MHRLLPVKQTLIKRCLVDDERCPVCGVGGETIEHFFFQCDRAQRIWRGSRLGLDFLVGNSVPFEEWFSQWTDEVPDVFALLESISILWAICCSRNECVFRQS